MGEVAKKLNQKAAIEIARKAYDLQMAKRSYWQALETAGVTIWNEISLCGNFLLAFCFVY